MTSGPNLLDRFESGLTFPEYLETVREHEELWRGVWKRARIPDDVLARARALPGEWRLLVLSEDWCGDAVNIVPVAARLADSLPALRLHVLARDQNLDIMDAHLTNGRSRSIPVIILLDQDGMERGWWGPRPSALQRWVMEEGMKMEPGPRYKETRAFYARDKGRTTALEIVEMIARCAPPPHPPNPETQSRRCSPLTETTPGP